MLLYFVILIIGIMFLVTAFVTVIEPAYILIFNKPVYVHLYIFPKQLPPLQSSLLEKEFSFYRKLSPQRKKYFQHRVNNFIAAYSFSGRDGLVVTDEMKLKVAATAVMLSFGMRRYLSDLFKVVLLYPDVFKSGNGEMHKGEFNPAVGAVVFSWKHFEDGLKYDNDNINLGLHEFAHVLHLESIGKRRPGSSGIVYADMFNSIMNYVSKPDVQQKLIELNYFRLYAYTNQFEFIAVILEYFFETPGEFRQKLPELYNMIRKMINYREG